MTISTHSNHFKFQKQLGAINLNTDILKVILMDSAFTFDKDAHATLSDVTANQLSTLYGYTQNDKELGVNTHTEDDTEDEAIIVYNNAAWTASGGSIGPIGSACIIDETAIETTEFFTTAIDQTFTGGSTHWVIGTIGTTFDEETNLSLVASAIDQYCAISFTDIGTPLVSGGLYRLTYDYTETTAGFEFKINGAALQVLGDAVAGTAQTIDFYADEEFATTDELRIYSKTGATAAGDFDNFSIKELGTVVGGIDFETEYTITDGTSFQINAITFTDA